MLLCPINSLHRPKIHTGHNQAAGEGVTQAVPGEILETGFPNGRAEPVGTFGDKHSPGTDAAGVQHVHDGQRSTIQAYKAATAVFGLIQVDGSRVQVDLVPLQR